MNGNNATKLWFTLVFLVMIPALVHTFLEGPYVVNPGGNRRVFWIGPVSTTLPYLFLAFMFLAHCTLLRSRSQISAYCGAVAAWLGMMGFTIFLILQTPGPKSSSTMGIAVAMTPFCYIPFLFLPYIAGTMVGAFWSGWKYSNVNREA